MSGLNTFTKDELEDLRLAASAKKCSMPGAMLRKLLDSYERLLAHTGADNEMSELYKCPICRADMRLVPRFGGGHVYMCHNDACEVVGQEIGTTMLEALNRRAPAAEHLVTARGLYFDPEDAARLDYETAGEPTTGAEQQQQEPVAWRVLHDNGTVFFTEKEPKTKWPEAVITPLYTHQQHHVSPAWTKLSDRCPELSANRRVVIYTDGYDFNGEQFFHVDADELNESFFGTAAVQPEECRLASHWIYAEDLMNSITHQQPRVQGAEPDQWRDLAAAMYQAAGAYDMPVRVLDALRAAANGEPFAHLVDGLLPIDSPEQPQAQGEPVDWAQAKTQAAAKFAEYYGNTNAEKEDIFWFGWNRCMEACEQPRAAVPDVDKIMAQAQVFASSWSLVGGQFDDGSMLETAEQEKEALRKMLTAAAPAQPGEGE